MAIAVLPDLGTPAHAGHVVSDLAEAMQGYTDELGLRWATPVSYGRGPHASRFTCSIGGPVTIELIQQVPGTIWSVDGGSPVHHLAYWADDMQDVVDAMVDRGLRLEAHGPTFAYLRSGLGMRIELMDRSLAPAWDRWLAGGQLFAS